MFNKILEQLRKSLSRDKNGDSGKDNAAAFFQHLVGGDFARAEAASADAADSARQLVAVLDAGFPQVYAFFELRQQLDVANNQPRGVVPMGDKLQKRAAWLS